MEEWTKEETGVGAAIAAGNQAEKGTWALLVIAASAISTTILPPKPGMAGCHKNLVPSSLNMAMANKISTSPIRLVRAVIRPAPYAFAF